MSNRSSLLVSILAASFSQGAFASPTPSSSPLAPQLGPEQALQLNMVPAGRPVIADIDGDGIADVVMLDEKRQLIVWEPGGPLRAGQRPSTIIGELSHGTTLAAGDVDGDGDTDIVAIAAAGSLVWFANPDAPEAWRATSIPTNITPDSAFLVALSLQLKDLDGNGSVDIAYAQGRDGSLPAVTGALINTGQGNFAPVEPWFPLGSKGLRTVARDLDGDGDLDAVAFGFQDLSIRVYRNDGALPFSLVASLDAGSSGSINDVSLFDVDGDGDLDVVGTTQEPSSLLSYLNDGSLQFSTSAPLVPAQASSGDWRDTVIEDFTGDGEEDIVIASRDPNQVDIWPGHGGGVFGPPSVIARGSLAVDSLEACDLDGDGLLDLVTTSFGIGTLWIRKSAAGPIDFDEPEVIAKGVFVPSDTLVMDVDGDGDLDVVAAPYPGIPVCWWSNEGGSRFLGSKSITALSSAIRIAKGDVDGDGLEDLFIGTLDSTGHVSLVARNAGGGHFEAPVSLDLPGGFLMDAQLVDLDGDGLRDLLAITRYAGQVPGYVVWGKGTGSGFAPVEMIGLNDQGYTALAVVDLNLDGLLDVVVNSASPLSRTIWYPGQPTGTFTSGVFISVAQNGSENAGLELVDVNRDGHLDIVRAEDGVDGRIIWHAATPQGPAPGVTLARGIHELQLLPPADVDGDGGLDLIMLESVLPLGIESGRVTWRELRSDGTAGPRRVVGRGLTAGTGDIGDLDGDGDTDLVVAGREAFTLSLFQGRRFVPVGDPSCTDSVPTSVGVPARIDATGSSSVAANQLTLVAYDLPANAAGFFLASETLTPAMPVTGSTGELCLGGAIGRFVGPGQVGFSGLSRSFQLSVDLSSMPTPSGLVQVLIGESWSFQGWFRDQLGGTTTSNFTGAVTVTFE